MASPAAPTTPPCSPARACWLRAWERAKAEQLIPYRETPTTWAVKTYTVTVTGAGWSDLKCSCPSRGVCKHMTVVAKAIAIGVSPVRGSAKGDFAAADDQAILRQAAYLSRIGATDGQIDAYLSQLRAADQQTFLAAYAALEAEPRETPYEAPAGEDVIWDAEQAYGDAIERDYEYLVERPRLVSETPPSFYDSRAIVTMSVSSPLDSMFA